jgi:2,4-dienoyl-CoA reductase-like NADH-dependent reductase (Old Yellow Enzyme family)
MGNLFDPVKIGSLELKNRLIMLPMGLGLGLRSRRATAFYEKRAQGGVAAIITGATPVDIFISDSAWGEEGATQKFLSGLSKLVNTVHAFGTKMAVQLWQGNRLPACSNVDKGELVAPSPCGEMRGLTLYEVRNIPLRFALAALKVKEAGCDFVEFHGAHGHLLFQFFSKHYNKRVDDFGGSLANRMRLSLECLRATKQLVSKDFPISWRRSAGDDDVDGVTLEEALTLAKALAQEGVDLLNVSFGSGHGDSIPDKKAPAATFASLAAAVRNVAPVPIIAAGKIH